jgi:hypothetical protein
MTAAEREQKLRAENRILREALLKAPALQRIEAQLYWAWYRTTRQNALNATQPLVEDLVHG